MPSWGKEPSMGIYSASASASAAAVVVAVVVFMAIAISLARSRHSHDPLEPPLIKPPIPVIGHFLGLAIHRVAYFTALFKEHKLSIATLPMVNSKLYVIFSAPLQQTAMRAKTMDAQSLTVEFIPRLFDIRRKTLLGLLGRDGVHDDITPSMLKAFQTSLSGEHLEEMTYKALEHVALTLNGIGENGLHISNLFLWLRGVMSHAVSGALFGNKHNPYGDGMAVVDAQWDFEAGLGPLVLGVLPSVTARSAYLARKKVSDALRPYYEANHDQQDGVSELVKARGRLFRAWDVPVDELSKNEISVMLAATTNTIPTLFWYIVHVWLRPGLVEQLRAEVSVLCSCLQGPGSTRQGPPAGVKEITIHFSKVESSCSLLCSCYREAIRLASQILTLRRVVADTVITDGKGRSYLLKAGNDVMMPAKVVHRDTETWGTDAEEFNPRRFLPDPNGDKDLDKLRKMSFVPFGGGKHLCPGRHFAFAENLAFMAALVLGYEVVGLDREKVRMEDSKMGQAAKPVTGFEGGPVVIRRRKGWENIEWKFSR